MSATNVQQVLARREEAMPGGFDGSALSTVSDNQSGAISAIAREEAELKAAIVLARQFPRNEVQAAAKVTRACQRPSFAESCVYSFPRGGQTVTGPSVDLAREAARCWTNIRFGLRIVSADHDWMHIKGWAMDVETNNYREAEDKFERLIFRKGKGWIEPDERDLRELVNRRGAICVRNAILQLLPPDLIDDSVREAKVTMRKAASGELSQDRESAIRRMAVAFQSVGVTVDMIETKIGHGIALMNDEELADMRTVYKSISDGNSKRDEHFELGARGRSEPTDGAATLDAKRADLIAALESEGPALGLTRQSLEALITRPLEQATQADIARLKDAFITARANAKAQPVADEKAEPTPTVEAAASDSRKQASDLFDGSKPSKNRK